MRGLQRMQGDPQGMREICREWPLTPVLALGCPPRIPISPWGVTAPHPPCQPRGALLAPLRVPGWARDRGAARDRRVLLDGCTEGRESGERGHDEVRPLGWGLGSGGHGGVTRVPPSLRGLRFFSLYRLRSLSRNTWWGAGQSPQP